MKKFISSLIIVLYLMGCHSSDRKNAVHINIIPSPVILKTGSGKFELSKFTQMILNDDGRFANETKFLQKLIKNAIGQELNYTDGKNKFIIEKSNKNLPPEGYELLITHNYIKLSAKENAGIFYGIQTIRQLLPPEVESGFVNDIIKLPTLSISDYPAYSWRGMNLDVSRHFFSINYLKKHIDRLALYKFNKLHLHLTDDQGWRIEIKKYPKLTEEGAWRSFNQQDSICMEIAKDNPDYEFDKEHLIKKNDKVLYGGYYTQEQITELVEFAQLNHIELIPEIDMPGHMMAATNSYPQLSTNGKSGWGGLFSYPLCACKNEVYNFLEDILTEITDLFPSKYVHIGADEVDKSYWEASFECKEFMKQEGLKDIDELQRYFIHKVQNFLASKGKEIIAWDEALEGGINPDVNIMYWRTWVANVPEKAVRNGNKVINAQGDPLYFGGNSPLYNVYHFNVVRNTIPQNMDSLIMGAHASLWTESVPSEKIADSKIFPRIMALSEVVWSPESNRDWDSFKSRLEKHLPRLDQLNVNYDYHPSYKIIPIMKVDTFNKNIGITFDSELIKPEIHYTTDGTLPTMNSELYTKSFFVNGSASIRAAIFENGERREPILSLPVDYHKAIGKKVTYAQTWNLSYPAGDAGTLTDGYRGGNSYSDGYWQGFTTDLDVTIDMGESLPLNTFSAAFMQLTGPGIYLPDSVVISLSEDGLKFEDVLNIKTNISKNDPNLIIKDFAGSFDGKTARYIHVVAYNGEKNFIFTDEIIIN